METVLVTGAAGFIGRSLVKQLLDDQYKVIGLDNLSFSNKDQLFEHKNMEWVYGDTRDFHLVSRLVSRSDRIIHLAAPSSFIMHVENDLDACNFTMMGFKTIMEALKLHKKKKIVWASTSAVYEEWARKPRVPFREDLPINPPDSKAGCKHWCELEAERYSNREGIVSVAFRPFSVYGVGEHTKGGYANVTSLFTWTMMEGLNPVVWSPGTQTRDLIFVDDAARAFKMAMEDDSLKTGVFNLGFGVEHAFIEIIELIAQKLLVDPHDFNIELVEVPIDIYAQRLWSDNTKLRQVLKFEPKIDLGKGIEMIIEATKRLPADLRAKLAKDQYYFRKLEPRKMVPLL